MSDVNPQDYIPSEHRGPGPIVDSNEAKRIRQQASQHETDAKKQRIAVTACATGGKASNACLMSVGGLGASRGTYFASRHKMSKRGKDIPEVNKIVLAGQYGDNWENTHEAPLLALVPKYDTTRPDNEVGTNLSPPCMSPDKAMKAGCKSVLRNAVSRNQGMPIAMAGVTLRNVAIAQLTATHAAGDTVPPTNDEIKAAMMLACQLSEHNSQAAPAARIPVNKYQDN